MNKREAKKQKQSHPEVRATPKEKSLKDYTIGDILKMPEYKNRLQKLLDELKTKRDAVKSQCKAHPIDSIIKRGVWNAEAMTGLYMLVLDKQLTGYSSNERAFIADVCYEPFAAIVAQMQKDEADRIKSNGAD